MACVLPADTESGKTTLTTGLVRAGFAYLTDEAVRSTGTTGEIEPYPKPLSIDPGSQFLFPELRPRRSSARADDDPRPVAGAAVAPSAPMRSAAVPRRATSCSRSTRRDAATALEPISRAEALVELAKNTFRFREQPRRGARRAGSRRARGRVLPARRRRPRRRVHDRRRA